MESEDEILDTEELTERESNELFLVSASQGAVNMACMDFEDAVEKLLAGVDTGGEMEVPDAQCREVLQKIIALRRERIAKITEVENGVKKYIESLPENERQEAIQRVLMIKEMM